MAGFFSLKSEKEGSESAEEYVEQLRVILEHECYGSRKKECMF